MTPLITVLLLSLTLSSSLTLNVCLGKTCSKQRSLETYHNLSLFTSKDVKIVGDPSCTSNCGKGPNVRGTKTGVLYNEIEATDVALMSAIIEIEGGEAEVRLERRTAEAKRQLITFRMPTHVTDIGRSSLLALATWRPDRNRRIYSADFFHSGC